MKQILPVLAGLGAIIVAGTVFFPVVYVVFDNFFHLFDTSSLHKTRDAVILITTLVAWGLFSSFAGAFACSLVAKKEEQFHILVLMVASFLIGLIASGGQLISGVPEMIFSILGTFLAGFISGGILGVRYKTRKKNKAAPQVSN